MSNRDDCILSRSWRYSAELSSQGTRSTWPGSPTSFRLVTSGPALWIDDLCFKTSSWVNYDVTKASVLQCLEMNSKACDDEIGYFIQSEFERLANVLIRWVAILKLITLGRGPLSPPPPPSPLRLMWAPLLQGTPTSPNRSYLRFQFESRAEIHGFVCWMKS